MSDRQTRSRRRYLKGLGVAGLATSIGGCLQGGGDGNGGGIDGPIQMGSILPVTGALSAYGNGMQEAANLAVEHINDAGGVRGAEISITNKDSETKPERALTKYDSLVSNQNIVGFVGAASSGVSTTIARNLAEDGVMQVSNASTSPVLATLGYTEDDVKLFGRTAPNDGQQGLIMGRIAENYVEADSIGLLHIDNAYGAGLAEKASEAFSGETTNTVAYAKRSQDYSSVLSSLHEGDPDAIGFVGYPENGGTILQQWANGDYGTSAEDWILSEGLNSDSFLTGNSDIVSGMYLASPNPEQTDGAEAFEEAIGDANTLFAAHAYDGMFLMALAMEKAGEADGVAIGENIQSVSRGSGTEVTVNEFETAASELEAGNEINYQGASSPVNLNDNLEPLNAFAILQIAGDGSRETLEEIPRSFFEGKL
jgi:ABC-type branched-subunit amino acid transport system substrate-binding protein